LPTANRKYIARLIGAVAISLLFAAPSNAQTTGGNASSGSGTTSGKSSMTGAAMQLNVFAALR